MATQITLEFEWEGQTIHDPSMDSTGRFQVEAAMYYRTLKPVTITLNGVYTILPPARFNDLMATLTKDA